MKVYLAGSVPKGDSEAKDYHDWRKDYIAILHTVIDTLEPADPNIFFRLEGDSLAVTGADCMLIKGSGLVIVNAEAKLGAGTAMELVIAKFFGKPVITVLPKNSHHRKSDVLFEGKNVIDWIHPFIDTFSDSVIERIEDIGAAYTSLKTKEIKTITVIDEAVSYAQAILAE